MTQALKKIVFSLQYQSVSGIYSLYGLYKPDTSYVMLVSISNNGFTGMHENECQWLCYISSSCFVMFRM